MVYSLPPNTTSACHWHTASQGTQPAALAKILLNLEGLSPNDGK
jgi:hypothetical protein